MLLENHTSCIGMMVYQGVSIFWAILSLVGQKLTLPPLRLFINFTALAFANGNNNDGYALVFNTIDQAITRLP